MKKILTILTVALLACTTVFAALNVSGEFEAGYKFSFEDGKYAAESQDAKEGKFVLKVTDDANIWTINIKALDKLDSSNKLDGNLALDLDALLAANGVDMGDVSLALSIGNNSAMTALSAYNDVTGDAGYKFKNNGNYSTELAVGYGDYIQTKIAFDPRANTRDNKGTVVEGTGNGSLVLSAMTAPVDGVKVSLAYSRDAIIYAKGSDDNAIYAVNAFGGAVDLNVGALAGLDFDLGVGVADRINFGSEIANGLAAQVYGGVDVASGYVEYVLDGDVSRLHAGVDLNVVENMILNLYGGAGDFSAENGNWYVGGNVGYSVSGITFQLNLQYAAGDYMTSKGGDIAQGAVKAEGFSVTPMLKVNF